jgi:hypothetical protein
VASPTSYVIIFAGAEANTAALFYGSLESAHLSFYMQMNVRHRAWPKVTSLTRARYASQSFSFSSMVSFYHFKSSTAILTPQPCALYPNQWLIPMRQSNQTNPSLYDKSPFQPSSLKAHLTASSTSLTITFGLCAGFVPSRYTPVLTKILVQSVPCGL